jgi:hypothetical protein
MWKEYDPKTEEEFVILPCSEFMTVTGKEFNEVHKGEKFYKITCKTELHYGMHYKNGLNVDIYPLKPGKNISGGLHFADKYNIFDYNSSCKWLREVTIPDKAQVYIGDGQYKSDMLFLKEREPLVDSELYRQYGDVFVLDYIDLLTNGHTLPEKWNYALCLRIVRDLGEMLEYIPDEFVTRHLHGIAVGDK